VQRNTAVSTIWVVYINILQLLTYSEHKILYYFKLIVVSNFLKPHPIHFMSQKTLNYENIYISDKTHSMEHSSVAAKLL
jgi:hypothetical protein